MRSLGLLATLVLFVQLVGCSTNMALVKGQTEIITSNKSIILIPVKISNKSNPGFIPYLINARITGSDNQTVNLNVAPFKAVELEYNDYLLNFSLAPGDYTISELSCYASAGPFFIANCVVPLNASIKVKPNSITYVGHVNTYVKGRTDDNESRAGGLFPLVPQSTSGFFNGTFVTNVEDRYEEDIANYRIEYPGLKTVLIEKTLLPNSR